MSQSGMIGTIMRSLKYIMDISKVVVLDWTDTTSGQTLSDSLIKQKKIIEFKGGLQLVLTYTQAVLISLFAKTTVENNTYFTLLL